MVQKLTAIIVPNVRNHEVWQKDAFRDGEFKFITKIDVRTISGGFWFQSICLLVEMKMLNFLIFRFIV